MLARRSIEGKRVRTQEQVYVIYSALINHVKFPRRPLRLLIKPRFDLIVLKDKGGDAVDHKRAVCLSTLYASLCSYSPPRARGNRSNANLSFSLRPLPSGIVVNLPATVTPH